MSSSRGNIIILGGGGHAKVLIELIRLRKEFTIAGILDPGLKQGSEISAIPVIGDDDMLPDLLRNRDIRYACIAVGSVRDTVRRRALYEKVRAMGFSVPLLIHPSAIVSESAEVSRGAQLMAHTVIQAGSTIGENTIVNTGAIIEHDCRIGSHIHICPAAVISGGCRIEEGSFIGAGATVIHQVHVGSNVTVAAGAVVIRDIANGATVRGVPAR